MCGSPNSHPVSGIRLALAATLALVWTTAGCGGAQIKTGLVHLDDRQQVLLGTAEGDVQVRGTYKKELARLVDAQVKVWGLGGASSIRVAAYQILDIGNGFNAYVGWIVLDQRGCRLVEWSTGREWTLVVPSLKEFHDEFRGLHGAKIWLTGFQDGEERLRPMQWGILQPPPDEE